jgi:hypothetical protein
MLQIIHQKAEIDQASGARLHINDLLLLAKLPDKCIGHTSPSGCFPDRNHFRDPLFKMIISSYTSFAY